MKVTLQNREKMLEIMSNVKQALNLDLSFFDTKGVRGTLWYRCWVFATYPNDNPNVLYKGDRIVDQIDFPLYPDKANDDHMDTAIKWCLNEIIKKEIKL
jgi:hypothetical protein